MVDTIRSARLEDAKGIAHVHIESWRTTYKDIVPADFLAALSYERRVEMWKMRLSASDPYVFMFVALDEHERVVGFVGGGKPREADESEYSSELYAIYLLKEYQGRGLGRLLVQQLMKSLVQVGLYSMFLWVLKDNPARRFYEALGGRRIREQPITIGGVALEEVVYGWKDVRIL